MGVSAVMLKTRLATIQHSNALSENQLSRCKSSIVRLSMLPKPAMRGIYDAAFFAAKSRQVDAQLRNAASDIGPAARDGKLLTSRSSSPESSNLNTLPSGNSTYSSPLNEATNLQPSGNLSGIFISTSAVTVSETPGHVCPKKESLAHKVFTSRAKKHHDELWFSLAQPTFCEAPTNTTNLNTHARFAQFPKYRLRDFVSTRLYGLLRHC